MTGALLAERADTQPRTGFHTLSVHEITPVAADGSALMLTLTVPPALRSTFDFEPGQHITVRLPGGERRSYSLCSTPAELHTRGRLRVGVRLVTDGVFSRFATALQPGGELSVLAPAGTFGTKLDPSRGRHYAAIVAGSGITPVLSLIAASLSVEPASRFSLVYANRSLSSAMFIDELAEHKDRHLGRLELSHLLSRQDRREGLLRGRPDAPTLRQLLPELLDPAGVDEWFVCGPGDVCTAATTALAGLGIADKQIHHELFTAAGTSGPRPDISQSNSSDAELSGADVGKLELIAYGRRTTAALLPGASLLDSALASNPELPYSCRTGVCGTCRASLTEGQAEVGAQWALTPEESAAGQILTCQATPRSKALTIDFDSI